jgi:SAM-dependent methyltransferase
MNSGVAPTAYFAEYYSNRDWRFYKATLAQIVRHSEPGPILDIGAGAGFLVEAAVGWGMECWGIEGSAEGIAIARERCPGINLRQHLLSEPLPFGDNSFQTVMLNQVIGHLEADMGAAVIGEIRRVLRPGGMVYIASPSRFNRRERKADPTHRHLYAPLELEALLARKGFVGVVPLNYPLEVFGGSYILRGIAYGVLRLTGWQRLSGTANCIAFRPS